MDWNDGPEQIGAGHYIHGRRLQRRPSFYVPVPRVGWELFYDRMHHTTGLAGIQLHEIWPPISWSEEFFQAVKYKWAAKCGVTSELIDQWSAFRSPDSPFLDKVWRSLPGFFDLPGATELKTQCRRGGACFVISTGCKSRAFEDLQSVTATE